ncbi:hypothetical protein TNCV_198221 [Trichonephila clavipes]|nr:hypothetical protein TNCV_198221 [Trichonephila clavipes]
MVLKVNDRRTSCPCHDEFRGPRSDYVRQKFLPTLSHLVKLLCRFRTAGRCASRHVCGGHQQRLNRESFEDDTSPVCHTRGKIQSTLPMMGQWFVADVVCRLLMVSLDGTGWLEGGKWR